MYKRAPDRVREYYVPLASYTFYAKSFREDEIHGRWFHVLHEYVETQARARRKNAAQRLPRTQRTPPSS